MERFERLFKARHIELIFAAVIFGRLQFSDSFCRLNAIGYFPKSEEGLQKAKISYVQGDILKAKIPPRQLIFSPSYSDVPSYFKPPREQTFCKK